ncbi:MAG: hypothetical protein ABSC54_00810 [Smithellaceae bacterium]|jgi:hypothetical protein
MSLQTEFDNKIAELIRQAEQMTDDQVAKAIQILERARREVLSTVGTTDWQIYHLPQLKTAIERAMQEFASRYGVELNRDESQFWNFGQQMVDDPLRTIGIIAAIPAIDTTIFGALQNYSKHLIDSLGADATAKIYNEFAMGLIGKKSPFEVMQAVGANLNEPSIFNSIASRAETITRQECGRILEEATQARMERAAEVVPGLKKQWKHGTSRVPRLTHLAAVDQVRAVNEPFLVGGEQLMYPRDMNGSPRNTINCSCYTVPYSADWSEALDKAA